MISPEHMPGVNIAVCRVCLSKNIQKFFFDNYTFPGKKLENWLNYYCFDCGAVSHFQNFGKKVSYADGEYRNRKYEESEQKEVLPPIDLPWSTISFKRWEHIYSLLKINTDIFDRGVIQHLDYGGYNGFLAYAFGQITKIQSTVADMDPKGLSMAEYLGSKIIDMSNESASFESYDLITLVHVLEHLENPELVLRTLSEKLNEDGIIYVEVPNLYGTPMTDEAHLIYFNKSSLLSLFKRIGLTVINISYCSTPNDSIYYGYRYPSPTENIYIVATNSKVRSEITFEVENNPSNIEDLIAVLTLSYSRIMLFSLSKLYFVAAFKFIKLCILFCISGSVDYISSTFFKRSISRSVLKYIKLPLSVFRIAKIKKNREG